MTSPDGQEWTARRSGSSRSLYGVSWSGSLYVAVGEWQTVLTSPDGIQWTARDSTITGGRTLQSVAYNGKLFCVVGRGGYVASSPDGVTWKSQVIGGGVSVGPSYFAVGTDGQQFVAVGQGIVSSDDCFSWKSAPPAGWAGVTFTSVGYSPEAKLWAAAGNVESTGLSIFTSPDGQTWTKRSAMGADATALKNGQVLGLRWSKSAGGFVAVGGASPNKTTITGEQFPKAGDIPMFALHSSADGAQWSATTPALSNGVGMSALSCVDECLGVGELGSVITSADGIAWQVARRWPKFTLRLNDVAWGDDEFIAVGAEGAAFTSPDGWSWTYHDTGTKNDLSRVVWSGTQYVAIGGPDMKSGVVVSPDAEHWTSVSIQDTDLLTPSCLAWTGRHFIASDKDGVTATSADGRHWRYLMGGTAVNGASNPSCASMRWQNGRLRALWIQSSGVVGGARGDTGSVSTSSDGITWTKEMFANGLATDMAEMANGVDLISVDSTAAPLFWSPDGGKSVLPAILRGGMIGQSTFGLTRIADAHSIAVVVGKNPFAGRNDVQASIYYSGSGSTWESADSSTAQDLTSAAWNGEVFVAVGGGGYAAVVVSP